MGLLKKHFLLLSHLLLQTLCILMQVSFYSPKTDISWFMYLFLMHFSAAKSSPLHKGGEKWLFLLDLIFFLQISFLPSVFDVFWCIFVKLELKFILLQYVVVSLSTVFRVRAASVKVLKSSLQCSVSAVALEQETLLYQDQKLLLARCPGQCCLFFLLC